jgi:hypothetical protein
MSSVASNTPSHPSSSSKPRGSDQMLHFNEADSIILHRPTLRNTDILRSSSHSQRSLSNALDVCAKVIRAEQRNETVVVKDGEERDVFDSSIVTERVFLWIQRWGKVLPVPPVEFLHNILTYRGYDTRLIPSLNPLDNRRLPTEKQVQDYDNDLVWAIRNSNLSRLKDLHSQGRSLSACNKFSESIVHMACRRSTVDVVKFLIENGADITIADDYGRTPLHDACWRPQPQFDIVALLLNHNLDLLRYQDVRGCIPLHYVREEHWLQWCAFFFNQIEKYWSPREVTQACAEDRTHFEPSAKRQKLESGESPTSLSEQGGCTVSVIEDGITT